MQKLKIVRNAIRCRRCGGVAECKTNDKIPCACGAVSVDGGLDYAMTTGNPCDYDDLCEFDGYDGTVREFAMLQWAFLHGQWFNGRITDRGTGGSPAEFSFYIPKHMSRTAARAHVQSRIANDIDPEVYRVSVIADAFSVEHEGAPAWRIDWIKCFSPWQ